jgi:hypothetical protein
MSKMITNLVTSVLYDADARINNWKKARYEYIVGELQNTRDLVLSSSSLLPEIEEFRRLCALQKTLHKWYAGAPLRMETVPPNTMEALERLSEAETIQQLDLGVYRVIDEVLEKCPNWTYGPPPVEAEVLPPSEVEATADADIPHTTDTGEDA